MYTEKLSKKVHDYLLRHINDVEMAKELHAMDNYSGGVAVSINFKAFINDYVSSIKKIIGNAKIEKGGEGICPFVIIGSVVEVEDVNDNKTYKYLITMPYSRYEEAGPDQASCLSPLGRALLLKGLNEKVRIEIPAGTLNYIIKSIELPDSFFER